MCNLWTFKTNFPEVNRSVHESFIRLNVFIMTLLLIPMVILAIINVIKLIKLGPEDNRGAQMVSVSLALSIIIFNVVCATRKLRTIIYYTPMLYGVIRVAFILITYYGVIPYSSFDTTEL